MAEGPFEFGQVVRDLLAARGVLPCLVDGGSVVFAHFEALPELPGRLVDLAWGHGAELVPVQALVGGGLDQGAEHGVVAVSYVLRFLEVRFEFVAVVELVVPQHRHGPSAPVRMFLPESGQLVPEPAAPTLFEPAEDGVVLIDRVGSAHVAQRGQARPVAQGLRLPYVRHAPAVRVGP